VINHRERKKNDENISYYVIWGGYHGNIYGIVSWQHFGSQCIKYDSQFVKCYTGTNMMHFYICKVHAAGECAENSHCI